MPAHAEGCNRAKYTARIELPTVIGIIQVAVRSKVVVGNHSTFLHPTYRDMKERCGFHILTEEPAVWSYSMLMQPHGQIDLELDGKSTCFMRVRQYFSPTISNECLLLRDIIAIMGAGAPELTLGHGWKIGTSSHAGHCVLVFLPEECLQHNLLAVASTGKGKSTPFQHLAQAVCASRAGANEEIGTVFAFIEPHGDVVHALCGLLSAHERDNVVLIDPANTDYPVGINPLDMVGKDRDKVVDTLITIAEHLWASSYGSRTENVLEYALKTLADANELLIQRDPYQGPDQQYTLLDVVPLVRAASFHHAVLEQVRDSLLTDWWQYYYEPLDAHQQREITSSSPPAVPHFPPW